MQAFSPSAGSVNVAGTRARYLEAGSGSPLLVLHGLGQSSTAWRRVMPAFALRHRTIALDLPGFGESPAPESQPYGGPEYFSKVVEATATALDLDRVDAIGHSAGGLALMLDALRSPARYRRIVLVDPVGFTPTPNNLLGSAAASLVRLFVGIPRTKAMTRALYSTAFFDSSRVDEETVDELARRHADPKAKRIARHTFTKFFDYCRRLEPFHERLTSLDVPILAIWGQDDRLFPASDAASLARVLPRVRLEIFEHCGHCPQIEQPERFVSVVEEFLSAS
ncbi:MAG TPA: alpha/beta fold hydrolase [Candidatus Eremiobacteraceae bacterium]|nr:alpha/beta fold hydrolase [Candidatus Eremiobacteraceae bacterium]